MTISYSNGAFELSNSQAQYVLDNIPDIEKDCDSDNDDSSSSSADTITLTGTLRDFDGYRDKNGNLSAGGHEDFERKNNVDKNPSGQKFKYGLDTGITTNTLGADKKPIYAGGSFSTTTKANFDQWYRNVPGVNQSMNYDIELTKESGSNVYSFDNNGAQFFPLDDLLLGNEGRNNNFHFTFEIHTQFTYQGGETFDFSGDDDVWVYINGQKVIDIGGVHGKTDASVNLDSLGLTVGETYDLDFFFAERHVTESNFKIETTIQLETAPDPDADEDNDGIPNILEGSEEGIDTDGDGIPDYEDTDSDNDTIPDSTEGTEDPDEDGTPNFQDTDSDENGIDDIEEGTEDLDEDGTDDFEDLDNDNDGIDDNDELVNDANDGDDDPDTIDGQVNDDVDDDGILNHNDTDSDNDGLNDDIDPDPYITTYAD
ncbi:fibro-slime domain-containing protein [Waterburya agarophytonicola K14]|uniref:Fibro-slime domain-containing protein n=2 Tax=Waterburya TaxID=2886915 RepID=A0A964BMZ0_9CYAN|nr:fibro-slime domain-containing protein [Waterburya agarophytonicola KI4]